MKPIALFFKSHVDTYTKKDGTVVQAHDDKRQSKKDWRDEENWHSRTQGKFATYTDDQLRYVAKDASEAAKNAYAMGNHKKGGQYDDEVHYSNMELKKRQDAKPPGIWEDDKQRDRLRDDAVRWANKEQGQYGSKWMRENLAAYFENRWHVPKRFTQPEIDKWFPEQ